MRDTVVMSPTYRQAVDAWGRYARAYKHIIKRALRSALIIELIDGRKIYFKTQAEGQRALRGLRAKVIAIDNFIGIGEAENEDQDNSNRDRVLG